MTHGIERLLINNLISSNDLIFRCRIINFDIDVFDNEVTENILNLEKTNIKSILDGKQFKMVH